MENKSVLIDTYSALARQAKKVEKLAARAYAAADAYSAGKAELETMRVAAEKAGR